MRTIKIAVLKDRLSEHLRAVEAGAEIEVTDRDRPIARIVPLPQGPPAITLVEPSRDFVSIRDKARPRWRGPQISTELLLEERRYVNVYVDSSVLLRIVLGETDPPSIWPDVATPVSSELIRVECLRSVDRALVRLDETVLNRAAEPSPTLLGSLDAIHLASALLARDHFDDLALATHDQAPGAVGRAMGLDVHGDRQRSVSPAPARAATRQEETWMRPRRQAERPGIRCGPHGAP